MRNKLIELKNDLYEVVKHIHDEPDDNNGLVKVIQEADIKLYGRARVINIQNSTININVTNNILKIIQKIDGVIEDMDRPDLVDNILKELFGEMLDSGVGIRELSDNLAFRYLQYAKKREGSLAAVARKTGEKRTTLHEWQKRRMS